MNCNASQPGIAPRDRPFRRLGKLDAGKHPACVTNLSRIKRTNLDYLESRRAAALYRALLYAIARWRLASMHPLRGGQLIWHAANLTVREPADERHALYA
jgi:hypothetical protein